MADVRPFHALRFNPQVVRDLSAVLCPPYDIITPAQQEELYRKSPYNIVRLEWGKVLPGDGPQQNVHSRAAEFFRSWVWEGVLVRDKAPALYLMQEQWGEGEASRRLVLFARVRLEEFGRRVIFPHEDTISAPKEDRFRLLQACGLNISPLLMLYADPGGLWSLLQEAARRPPEVQARSWEGVAYRFWALRDAPLMEEVRARLSPGPLYIADGHHRYETALRYRDWRRGQEREKGEAPYDFVLAGLAALDDPGLRILPIHRVIQGPPEALQAVRRRVQEAFQREPYPLGGFSLAEVKGFLAFLERQPLEPPAFGLLDGTGGDTWLLRLTAPLPTPAVPALLRCDTWTLHQVLPRDNALEFHFLHDLGTVVEAVQSRRALAFLLRPLRPETFEAVVRSGERLPPKSTYFVPKLPTGLVLYSLEK